MSEADDTNTIRLPADGTDTKVIAKAAGKGLKWSLLGTVGTKIASFLVGLILARLLTPEDFGTFAIASAAAVFATHVNDVGIIAAAVQWRGRLREIAPTATALAVIFSTVFYAGIWLAAPAFTELAGDPAAATPVRVLCLIILIDGVTAVRAAALMRRFQQDKLTAANSAGFAASAITSVSLALLGAGAYAFVLGQVVGAVVTGVLVLVLAKVPFSIGIDRKIAGKLMKFGLPLAASLGVEALLMNADYVVVGRVLGVVAVGYYLLAFNISSWAQGMIGTAIRYVSIAAFSRLSDHDTKSLSRGVQRAVPLLVTAVAPICALIMALGPQLIEALYGVKWLPAAPVLTFLMVLTGVRLLMSLVLDVLTGAGATKSSFWVNLAWAVALVPALIVATQIDGVRGAAVAHAVVGLVVALPVGGYALRKAGVRLGPIPRQIVRPLLGGVVSAGVALGVAESIGDHPYAQLIAGGIAGLAVYLVVAVPRREVRAWISAARGRDFEPGGSAADASEAGHDRGRRDQVTADVDVVDAEHLTPFVQQFGAVAGRAGQDGRRLVEDAWVVDADR
jgi:O-antigen/teichoic acid export membrane protein